MSPSRAFKPTDRLAWTMETYRTHKIEYDTRVAGMRNLASKRILLERMTAYTLVQVLDTVVF